MLAINVQPGQTNCKPLQRRTTLICLEIQAENAHHSMKATVHVKERVLECSVNLWKELTAASTKGVLPFWIRELFVNDVVLSLFGQRHGRFAHVAVSCR